MVVPVVVEADQAEAALAVEVSEAAAVPLLPEWDQVSPGRGSETPGIFGAIFVAIVASIMMTSFSLAALGIRSFIPSVTDTIPMGIIRRPGMATDMATVLTVRRGIRFPQS
jgi:putative effector of murein hydrolase